MDSVLNLRSMSSTALESGLSLWCSTYIDWHETGSYAANATDDIDNFCRLHGI